MMKNLIFALIIICAASCKTEKIVLDEGDVNLANIYGEWDWVQSSGGFAGNTITPVSVGHTMALDIKKNNTIATYQSDSLINEDRFTVAKGKSIFSTDQLYIITMKSNGFGKVILKAKSDTLVLADNVYDGYTAAYVRRK